MVYPGSGSLINQLEYTSKCTKMRGGLDYNKIYSSRLILKTSHPFPFEPFPP